MVGDNGRVTPGSNGMYFHRAGEGTPVVLTHGVAGSHHDWEDLSAALHPHGYSTLAPDLFGHGDSAKPSRREEYGSEAIYRAFAGWLDGLSLGQPPILIGHSLGGGLSLRYACEHPQSVRALVLIDPYFTPLQLHPLVRTAGRFPALCEFGMRYASGPAMRLALNLAPGYSNLLSASSRRQMVADNRRATPFILHSAASIGDFSAAVDGVPFPSLVIWGERDLTLNPASFPRLVARLPRARGVPVPGAPHFPHRTHFAVVWESISSFLQEI